MARTRGRARDSSKRITSVHSVITRSTSIAATTFVLPSTNAPLGRRLRAPYLVHGNSARVRVGWHEKDEEEESRIKRRRERERRKGKKAQERRRIRGGPIGLELIAVTPVPPSRRAPRTDSPLWESMLNASLTFLQRFSDRGDAVRFFL